jgi:hypothetical protein
MVGNGGKWWDGKCNKVSLLKKRNGTQKYRFVKFHHPSNLATIRDKQMSIKGRRHP